jgi:long-chain acyl-CoA synthetase
MSTSSPPPFSPSTAPFSVITVHAKRTPEKPAVICGGETLTYKALVDRVAAASGGLREHGIRQGQRVAIETENALEHLVGLLSALSVGAIAVALSRDAASYQAIVADCEPSLIISTGDVAERDDFVPDIPRRHIRDLVIKGDVGSKELDRPLRADEIAMLYYTSGTSSGVRKGVMQSYGQLHNTVHYITQIMRTDESVCEFVASPTDNAFWFGRCRCILHVGGTALLSSGVLNPLSMVSALNRHHGNAIAGDTGIYLLLLHHMEKHLVRLGSSILWAKIASAPMPAEDKLRLMELLPNARIIMNYGLTEAMRTCLHPFRESPEKLASVGRPCPSVLLRIVDAQGKQLPPDAIGEVMISGGNLASGYWRNEELWKTRFQNGWYHSGDLGHLDKDGFLYLHGRIDHAINSGGKTISLHEVEELVRPFIRDTSFAACAASDPKGVLGEVVVLCVEGRWGEPTAWSDLRIRLFEAMEPLLVPAMAYAVPEFPRTSNGKIQLNELRKRVEGGQCENL